MTKTRATCKKCGKTYNIASGQRTGLKNHMKNKHDIVIPDEKKPTSSTSSAGSGNMDSYVKKEPKQPIEDLIAEEAARGTYHKLIKHTCLSLTYVYYLVGT